MEAAEVRDHDERDVVGDLMRFGCPERFLVGRIRDIAIEAHVRTRMVIVDRETLEQSVEMAHTERPDPVEQLATERADESFGICVGLWATEPGAEWLDPEVLDRFVDPSEELIVVVDDEAPVVIGGNRFEELFGLEISQKRLLGNARRR
jgi:hypothetical protein